MSDLLERLNRGEQPGPADQLRFWQFVRNVRAGIVGECPDAALFAEQLIGMWEASFIGQIMLAWGVSEEEATAKIGDLVEHQLGLYGSLVAMEADLTGRS